MPSKILEICAIDGIAGLKYTSEDLGTLARLLALRDPEKVTVLSPARTRLFLATFALGVDGAIGTMRQLMPRLYIDIMGAAAAGDLATARRPQHAAGDLIAARTPWGAARRQGAPELHGLQGRELRSPHAPSLCRTDTSPAARDGR